MAELMYRLRIDVKLASGRVMCRDMEIDPVLIDQRDYVHMVVDQMLEELERAREVSEHRSGILAEVKGEG